MTRQEAVRRYLSRQKLSGESIRRLIDWNPKVSIVKNAADLNIGYNTAKHFARFYGLNSIFIGSGNNYRCIKERFYKK